MSEMISPKVHLKYGIEMVCRTWQFSRSTFYHQKVSEKGEKRKRGKSSLITDEGIRLH